VRFHSKPPSKKILRGDIATGKEKTDVITGDGRISLGHFWSRASIKSEEK